MSRIPFSDSSVPFGVDPNGSDAMSGEEFNKRFHPPKHQHIHGRSSANLIHNVLNAVVASIDKLLADKDCPFSKVFINSNSDSSVRLGLMTVALAIELMSSYDSISKLFDEGSEKAKALISKRRPNADIERDYYLLVDTIDSMNTLVTFAQVQLSVMLKTRDGKDPRGVLQFPIPPEIDNMLVEVYKWFKEPGDIGILPKEIKQTQTFSGLSGRPQFVALAINILSTTIYAALRNEELTSAQAYLFLMICL
jgi:hypothetical protein